MSLFEPTAGDCFAFATTVFVVYRKNVPNRANQSPETFQCAFARRGEARRWAQQNIGINRRGSEVFEIVRTRVPVHDCIK